jgi:hypothetical protein
MDLASSILESGMMTVFYGRDANLGLVRVKKSVCFRLK